mmetsp:Transcript_27183/g.60016  ORF Transcript_27183/g.60016 Transcript_27183/m.60016 type:complete len:464 (+) Transcript_27183:204-1595(+)
MNTRTAKNRKGGPTTTFFMAVCVFSLGGLGMLSLIGNSCSDWSQHHKEEHPQSGSGKTQNLEDFRRPRPPVSEMHVISLQESKFGIFEQRNFDLAGNIEDTDDAVDELSLSTSTSIEWFPGYNAMDQAVLNEWSEITQLPPLKATDFEGKKEKPYRSPHTVGCYLSHWRLLERAWKSWKRSDSNNNNDNDNNQQQRKKRPDMLFVFEDDAICVSKLVERTWKVVQSLPRDWDILYIGGKPMAYHTNGHAIRELSKNSPNDTEKAMPKPSNSELMRRVCNGDFGISYSGPFLPGVSDRGKASDDTTAKEVLEAAYGAKEYPPYWRMKYVLNTNAYVVNPRRIKRILWVLSQPMNSYRPIDVTYGDEAFREFFEPWHYDKDTENENASTTKTAAPLKTYLTPKMYCDQEALRHVVHRDKPPDWEGYFWIPWRRFQGFPGGYDGYVWGKIAVPNTCNATVATSVAN